MNYNIISTGSQGNAVVVNNHILIDCGVTFKTLKGVYKDLQIVLLTHIHTDHFKPKTLKRLAQERPTLRFG
jgi:glyoxylase-like metal-dependent hydrolase (beta-lactamase superfamily II)